MHAARALIVVNHPGAGDGAPTAAAAPVSGIGSHHPRGTRGAGKSASSPLRRTAGLDSQLVASLIWSVLLVHVISSTGAQHPF